MLLIASLAMAMLATSLSATVSATVVAVPSEVAATGIWWATYIGVLQAGETDNIECTVLDCPPDPLCHLDVVDMRLELTAFGVPGDKLVLAYNDLEAETTGYPIMTASLRITGDSGCIGAKVHGERVAAAAAYTLGVK